MATADTGNNKSAPKSDPTKDLKAPEGFNTSVARKMADGWVKKGVGVTVQGRLLGRQTMKGKLNANGEPRAFYQIELQVPVLAIKSLREEDDGYDPDDEEANKGIEVKLTPGMTINVDESAALRDLEVYTRDGGTYDVWFAYTGQDAKFRNMWRVKGPQLKIISPAKHQVSPMERKGDLPF